MKTLEDILGYSFKESAWLEEALTHPSMGKLQKGLPFNYQRLEFLGDRVLGLIAAEILFELYPNENEGSLAKRHAALTRSETLAEVLQSLDIAPFIIMAQSEETTGGRSSRSNLEDVAEALIGAIYMDGGLRAAEKFIRKHWTNIATSQVEAPKDAKTTLQEWAQARGLPLPVYKVIATDGPSHAPIFTIEVELKNQKPEQASGASKRIAEQAAAQLMLEKLPK